MKSTFGAREVSLPPAKARLRRRVDVVSEGVFQLTRPRDRPPPTNADTGSTHLPHPRADRGNTSEPH